MKKIYLLSGPGATEGFSNEIIRSLKKDLKGLKTISFIASSPKNHEKNLKYIFGNREVTGIINHLKVANTFDEVNVIDESNIDIDTLKKSDVIYLLGGNYETQLSFINDNAFDKILREFDGVLLCTSCGAMNIAENGYYSKHEDIEKSFFYKGIGVTNITIDPHFDIKNKMQVEEDKNMSVIHKIYGIPNDSCIKISNNRIEYIGKIYIFENGEMIIGD